MYVIDYDSDFIVCLFFLGLVFKVFRIVLLVFRGICLFKEGGLLVILRDN